MVVSPFASSPSTVWPSADAKRMPPREQHCASPRADAPAQIVRHDVVDIGLGRVSEGKTT